MPDDALPADQQRHWRSDSDVTSIADAREHVDRVVDDETVREHLNLDIDRFYRAILTDDVDFDRADAVLLFRQHETIVGDHLREPEYEQLQLYRGYLYDGARPDRFDFSELSDLEREILRLERRGLERWRADHADGTDGGGR